MHIPSDISIEALVCHDSFQRYCLGSSMAEQLFWQEWLQNNPARCDDFEEAKKLFYIISARQGNRLEQLRQLKSGIQQSEAFKNILSAPVAEKEATTAGRPVAFAAIYKYAGGMAAAALVLLLFYFLLYLPSPTNNAPHKQQAQMQMISSGASPRKTVVLADGSVITLRKNSILKLLPGFNSSNREVWLSGEAFFDIRHDAGHPFVVHALFTDIKVLGTIFNVQAYPGVASTETSLLKGSIEVTLKKYPAKSIILKPNQKLVSRLSGTGIPTSIEKPFEVTSLNKQPAVHPAEETAWVRSRLDIDNEPLSLIAKRLEKWYGIRITFADEEVKSYRYSGVFENENVTSSLKALQLSYPFAFEVEQDKIIISKQKNKAPEQLPANQNSL